MKELYLGLSVVALILLILSMTVETSLTGSYFDNENKSNDVTRQSTISVDDFKNTYPERAYNKDNLNRVFLKKYYNQDFLCLLK